MSSDSSAQFVFKWQMMSSVRFFDFYFRRNDPISVWFSQEFLHTHTYTHRYGNPWFITTSCLNVTVGCLSLYERFGDVMWRRKTLLWLLVEWRLLVSYWFRWRFIACSVQWRHNGRDSVSNHQPHDCFLKRLFRHRSKKTSKLRVTGLCARNSPEAGEFPAQMASNAENVSIWWRHQVRAIPSPGLMITYRQLKIHKSEAIAFYTKNHMFSTRT